MQIRSDRRVVAWLLSCCALIFAMVVLGGVTRLTRSGLSIVEWEPVMGALPPLSHGQWLEVFHLYQQTPEYKLVNFGMSLEAFQDIFWVEYSHRLLGRLIGIAFLVPFLYFLATKQLARNLAPRLTLIFVLGGLQGAIGWFMVKSGLVDNPHVSPYRLTTHLGMAFLLYAAILWTALGLLTQGETTSRPAVTRGLRHFARAVTALVFLMVLSGGFVAGTRAGFACNTFPTMAGHWVPPGMFSIEPTIRNFFENLTTVQFNHRLLATVLSLVIPALWWRVRQAPVSPRTRRLAHLLLGVLGLQVSLGIATLLLVVPVPLAAAHQGGALVLFTMALMVTYALEREPVLETAADRARRHQVGSAKKERPSLEAGLVN